MKKYRWLLLMLLTLICHTLLQGQTAIINNATEKIFYNAKIFTANAQQPYAEAIAVSGDKIVAIGNLEDVKSFVGANAAMINLDGGFLMPGFIDSHSHSIEGGTSLMKANVFDSAMPAEKLALYAEEVRANGKGMQGDVLVIDGINISTWSSLDDISTTFNSGSYTDQPLLLLGSDGHTGWANKIMMQRAGISKDFIQTLSQEQKKYFGFNERYEPNGFIADSGFDKIDPVLPADNTDMHEAAVKAVKYNNGLGITAWLDPAAGDIEDKEDSNEILEAYKYLSQNGKLTAHVAAVVVADANSNPSSQIAKLRSLQKKYKSIHDLSVIGFKIFADGVIEYPTQTAALSKPYTNTGSKGVLMFDPKKFAGFVTAADKEKLLVHVHAIGDLAVTETLNGFAAARKANGNSGIPHTITHIQVAQPADFARFHQLGVLASLQLLWALGDVTTIDIVKPYVDPGLYKYQYPARSLLQAGAVICGASDWPVSTANPFAAIYEAETRKGKMGVLDSVQCMPRIAMLYAYTINAARALQEEKKIGSLEPGKQADIVLLDRDILTVSPEEMEATKVVWTMFGGKIVYEEKQ